ncbi:hypothetical protein A3Q56_05016, partial [Intoshia linei]
FDNVVCLINDNCAANKSLSDKCHKPLVVQSCKTRWSSTAEIVRQYFQVKEYLVNFDDTPLIDKMLNVRENDNLQKLNGPIDCLTVIILFDPTAVGKIYPFPLSTLKMTFLLSPYYLHIKKKKEKRVDISLYLCMSQHLSTESNIVNSKNFETGIVKIMTGYEDNLNNIEVGATSQLLKMSINNIVIECIN